MDAAIAVVNEAGDRTLAGGGAAEGGQGQLGTHVFAAVMGQAAPGAGIERESQIEPALPRLEVGEVALPDHPRPIRCGHFGEPVLGDPVTMAAVGGAGPEAALLPGSQARFAHEAVDPVLAAAMPGLAQIEPHPRAAVGAPALLESPAQQGPQLGVSPPTWPLGLAQVSVEAASGDFQRLGHFRDGELVFHGLHQIEEPGGISADKMPTAFFRMSRWRRR